MIGAYGSLSSFQSPLQGTGDFGPQFQYRFSLSQQSALAVGLQATRWMRGNWGIRVHASSAASSVDFTYQGQPTGQQPEAARVSVIGAEGLLPVSRLESGTTVFLSGGGALVLRGGKAFRGHSGTTDVAGALGFGSQVPVGERLRFEGDVRVLLYRLGMADSTGAAYLPGTQTDALAYVGLVLGLGGDRER